jgi:hypothetical protein
MARRSAAWFGVWLLVGAGFSLGSLSVIGIFLIPAAVVLTVFAATRRQSGDGIAGVISGLGLPLLYIAYLNRDGPGTVCRAFAGGESCTDEWSPWPWLGIGALLVLGGVAVFVAQQRTQRHPARA